MHCLRLKNSAIVSFATVAALIGFVEMTGDEELKKLNGLQKKTPTDLGLAKPARIRKGSIHLIFVDLSSRHWGQVQLVKATAA